MPRLRASGHRPAWRCRIWSEVLGAPAEAPMFDGAQLRPPGDPGRRHGQPGVPPGSFFQRARHRTAAGAAGAGRILRPGHRRNDLDRGGAAEAGDGVVGGYGFPAGEAELPSRSNSSTKLHFAVKGEPKQLLQIHMCLISCAVSRRQTVECPFCRASETAYAQTKCIGSHLAGEERI